MLLGPAVQRQPPAIASAERNGTHDLSEGLLLLVSRLGIASIFLLSARTKVSGLITITPQTYELFRTEYALPLISPNVAAVVATWSEHLLSMFLIIGLFTRISAMGLLTMTAVIEIFVYPDAWPTHLSWAGLLLPLIVKGGGVISLENLIKSRGRK